MKLTGLETVTLCPLGDTRGRSAAPHRGRPVLVGGGHPPQRRGAHADPGAPLRVASTPG
ncbi:hypothetical protein LV779_21280 [Streptomyces thinghirensis]|nr:hypothetical protein [Streptomyces thinghirensis]